MRVFLDANILFSAAQPRSRTSALLELLFEKRAACLTNHYAADEARRNLALKLPGALRRLEVLVKQCEIIPAIVADFGVALAAKDAPILGGAVAGRATHLLTGDARDFGKYFGRTVRGVKIVSPRMLAEELLAGVGK